MLVFTSTRPGSTFEAMAEMSEGAPAPVEEFPDDPDPDGEDPLPDDPEPEGSPELGLAIALVPDWADHTRWPTPAPSRIAAAAIEATATIGRCRRFAGPGCGDGLVKPGGTHPPGGGAPPPHPQPGGTPWDPPGPQPGHGD